MLNDSFRIRPVIVSMARGDVNQDGILDYIYLTGVKTMNSPFTQQITIVIKDGKTGMITSIPLKTNGGYNPTLYLRDFTGDGNNEILISITSGGSGGTIYYYIYSFIMNNPTLLFDYEVFNNSYQYQVLFKDDYKVDVINSTNDTKFVLDISYKGSDYLNEIYNTDGQLKKSIEGFVSPISGLYPVDFNADHVYSLLAYQRISGKYAADALGYIQTKLKWKDTSFILDDQSVSIKGSKI